MEDDGGRYGGQHRKAEGHEEHPCESTPGGIAPVVDRSGDVGITLYLALDAVWADATVKYRRRVFQLRQAGRLRLVGVKRVLGSLAHVARISV